MNQLRRSIELIFGKLSPDELLDMLFARYGREVSGKKRVHAGKITRIASLEDLFQRHGASEFPFLSLDEITNLHIKLKDDWGKEAGFLSSEGEVWHLLWNFTKPVLLECDEEPMVKFEELLRWRDLSHLLGEDIFSCSYLANKDLHHRRERHFFGWRPVLQSDNSRLRKMLGKGLAENHYHLYGSAVIFELSWISLMNNITSRQQDFKKLDEDGKMATQQGITFAQNESSLHHLVKQAAYIRALLFRNYREAPRKSEVTQTDKDDFCSSDPDFIWHNPHLYLQREQDDFNLRTSLSEIQRTIDGLKFSFGRRFNGDGIREQIPDYAIPCNIHEANFNHGNILLTGERRFLYDGFKKAYSSDKSACLEQLFFVYLVIKARFRAELIQVNNRVGFANFSDYQNRKTCFIPEHSIYWNGFVNSALHATMRNQLLRRFETRITPKTTSELLKNDIRNNQRIYFDKTFIQPDYSPVHRYLDRIQKQQDGISGNADNSNYFYVLHFIKRKHQFGKIRPALFISCRHKELRDKVKAETRAIINLKQRWTNASEQILGIDAASNEIGCRPEVFAQAFRCLKNYHSDGRHDLLKSELKEIRLGATYHVGEDFLDIVDGLRAIDEAITFLNLRDGDRLGHALALGIEPAEFYAFKGNQLMIPKQDMLDNMVWLIHKINEFGLSGFGELKSFLESAYDELFQEIHCYCPANVRNSHLTPHTYYMAMQLRGDDPWLYFSGESIRKDYNMVSIDNWDRCGLNENEPRLVAYRENRLLRQLYREYHFNPDVKKRGAGIKRFDIPGHYSEAVRQIQTRMQFEIMHRRIGIETNPTSNYLIGTFKRYAKHPIVRWFNLGLETDPVKIAACPQLHVSINTDDQGVFGTYLENEYALMAIALEKEKDEHGNPKYKPAMIYDWLDRIRQMGLEQSFKRT